MEAYLVYNKTNGISSPIGTNAIPNNEHGTLTPIRMIIMVTIKYVNAKFLDAKERIELGIEISEGMFTVKIDDDGSKTVTQLKKGVVEFEIGE